MFGTLIRSIIIASIGLNAMAHAAAPVSPMLQQTVEKLTADERVYVKQQLQDPADLKSLKSTASAVGEWAELGTRVGVGIASAAKELGIAAAEFSQTPIGKVIVAVLVFKMVGKTVILSIVGLSLLIVSIPLGMKFIRNQKIPTGEYTQQNIFGFSRDVPTYKYIEQADYQILFGWVITLGGAILGVACLINA